MIKNLIADPAIDGLLVSLEEALQTTGSTSGRFIEPASGTLARALANRNHLVFGRRGSGKTSLLQKARAELVAERRPNAYIDMEKFKGHTYPDVLISVLIETFENISGWLTGGAVAPANKVSFWRRIRPKRSPLPRREAKRLQEEIDSYTKELETLLHAFDDAELETLQRNEHASEATDGIKIGPKLAGLTVETSMLDAVKSLSGNEIREKSRRSKTDFLHRRIISYQKTLRNVVTLAGANGFVMMDDLYHIKRSSQAEVLDYFHRLFKGSGLWLKVGTVRHRSTWYRHGDPALGIKLGDDVEEIDLDLTLEKYRTAKRFLLQVADSISGEHDIDIRQLVNEGARDRLCLASGGVARDFLSILRKSIVLAREQGSNIIKTEVVNQATGEHESSKRDEFRRDVHDGRQTLENEFDKIKAFCLTGLRKNCFLVEKDLEATDYERIKELVDVKLIHTIASRVTVRHRPGRIYEAYMVDVSQYTGERKRRNLDIIEFWKKAGEEKLRGASLIYDERKTVRP